MKIKARERNTIHAKKDVLSVFGKNCVVNLGFVYIEMNHKWGKRLIRRALQELVSEHKLLKHTVAKNIVFYERADNDFSR